MWRDVPRGRSASARSLQVNIQPFARGPWEGPRMGPSCDEARPPFAPPRRPFFPAGRNKRGPGGAGNPGRLLRLSFPVGDEGALRPGRSRLPHRDGKGDGWDVLRASEGLSSGLGVVRTRGGSVTALRRCDWGTSGLSGFFGPPPLVCPPLPFGTWRRGRGQVPGSVTRALTAMGGSFRGWGGSR